MHYNLIILDTAYNMYMDMVYMLMYLFDVDNKSYTLIDYNSTLFNDENNKCVFFGSEYYKYRIPKNSIIMEFDPIMVVKNRLNLTLVKNNKIYSYSTILNNFIKKTYPNSSVDKFFYGYSPYLDYSDKFNITQKDIDICFIGSVDFGRKKDIINKIEQKFSNKNLFFGGYKPFLAGSERANIYLRSKIILSLYTYEDLFQYSSGSRIFPAVSTGGFVIAEECTDIEQHNILEKICVNIKPDKLIDTIDYYLTNSEERENLRKQFYENVKKIKPMIY